MLIFSRKLMSKIDRVLWQMLNGNAFDISECMDMFGDIYESFCESAAETHKRTMKKS